MVDFFTNYIIIFLKMDRPGLFFVYFCLFKQTLQFFKQINVKMSIQFMILRFEPATFRTRVTYHDH